MNFLTKKIENIFNETAFVNDEQREKSALTFMALVIAVISTIMSTINLFTVRGSLLFITSLYSLLNYILFFSFFNITNIKSFKYKINKIIFLMLTFLILIYFFISGKPDGFSIIWALIAPISAFYFLDNNYSISYTLSIFSLVIFFCWIPLGRSLLLFEYSDAFLLRFPFAYLAFCLVGISIEAIRTKTYQNLMIITKKFEALSKYDSLTKIYNRQTFENNMLNISYPSTLIMFDLDFFKNINDTYGHICGDSILQQFSYILKEEFKDSGKTFRWGGEEFIVLINNVENFDEIKRQCESLRINIEKMKFYHKNVEIHLTTSIGLLYVKSEKENFEIINILDEILYSAKERGRNCSVSKIL